MEHIYSVEWNFLFHCFNIQALLLDQAQKEIVITDSTCISSHTCMLMHRTPEQRLPSWVGFIVKISIFHSVNFLSRKFLKKRYLEKPYWLSHTKYFAHTLLLLERTSCESELSLSDKNCFNWCTALKYSSAGLSGLTEVILQNCKILRKLEHNE